MGSFKKQGNLKFLKLSYLKLTFLIPVRRLQYVNIEKTFSSSFLKYCNAWAYLEPCQTSITKTFCETSKGFCV